MDKLDVSIIIKAVDVLTAPLKKMRSGLGNFGQSLDNLKEKMKNVSEGFKRVGQDLTLKLTTPLVLFGTIALRNAAKLETMRTSFVGILGSVDKAGKLVEQLNKFTAKTPFQLEAVAGSAKKLLASKEFDANEIPDALQMIGDMASAANTDLEGLAAVYSKAAAKGKVQGEIFEMFNDRGIPVLAAMAEQMGKSKAEILEMGAKGKITFEDLMLATKKMTSKGGFAYRAMILQSETLEGVTSTLSDNFMLMSATIGQVFLPTAKALAIKLISVFEAISSFATAHPTLTKIVAIFGAMLAVLGPIILGIGLLSSAIVATSQALAIAAVAGKVFWSAITGPVGITIAIVTTLIGLGVILYKKWEPFRNLVNQIGAGIAKFANGVGGLLNIGNPKTPPPKSNNKKTPAGKSPNSKGTLNLPEHHTGLKTSPDEHLAVILKNERVLSPNESKNYDSMKAGAGSVHVTYSPVVNVGAGANIDDFKKLLAQHKKEIVNIVENAQRNKMRLAY